MFRVYRFETKGGGWIELTASSYSSARAVANKATNAGLASRMPCRITPAILMVDRECLAYQASCVRDHYMGSLYACLFTNPVPAIWQ